tara:strand:- start:25403 stop:25801 length:399 start_codon:yes stop_codon:yes gene_type:complete
MKTRVLIFSIIGIMTFSSCNQSTDASSMLDNPETRNEIFNTIAGNHDMMTSFMETIQTNDHAMQMMQDSKMMMGTMMHGNNMQMMMKDSTMMGNMMQMMQENGMMCDECMQAMQQMMSEKGMGKMNQEKAHQ